MTSSAPTLGRNSQWSFTCSGTFFVKGFANRLGSFGVPVPGSAGGSGKWADPSSLLLLPCWLPFFMAYTGAIIVYWLHLDSVPGCGYGDAMTLWCSFFLSAMDNLQERALHIRKVLLNLPKTTLIVMRYLFAFLNQWVSPRAPWPCCSTWCKRDEWHNNRP